MSDKKVVICGGGIIGCSVAYFLSKLGQVDVTVVERHEIAGQASGKAGGFLALDWNDGGPVGALARHSFELHDQLAREMAPHDVGYRRMKTFSVRANKNDSEAPRPTPEHLPEWIDAKVRGVESLGNRETTAQVHPYKLTNAFLDAAKEKGAKVVKGNVQRVVYDEGGDHQVVGVVVDGVTIDANVVVIAMGPWSGVAASFFPGSGLPKITGTRAHSIIMDVKEKRIGAEAIFLSYADEQNDLKDPEIYPREDGTVYVCGESDNCPLPEDPADVSFDSTACKKLEVIAGHMSTFIKNSAGNVVQHQACYLPCSPDGFPLIGKVPGYKGAYIATGHSCWGILNGPATGETLAQMILGLEPSVSIDRLSPGRFLKCK